MGSTQVSVDILRLLITFPQIKINPVWTNTPRPKGRKRLLQETPVSTWVKSQPEIELKEIEKIDFKEIDYLKSQSLDAILVVACGHILPPDWIALPRLGCFNIHFSLLPRYRGASPIQAAILNGDTETGITIQKIDEKLDTGDIILSQSFPLTGLDAQQAFAKSISSVKSVLPEFVRQLIEENLKFTPQNLSQYSRGEELDGHYCRKIKKDSGLIRSPMSITEVFRKFLAYQPWPGIYFHIKEDMYIIRELEKPSYQLFEDICNQYGDTFLQSLARKEDNNLSLIKLNHPARLFLVARSTESESELFRDQEYRLEFLSIHTIQKSGKRPVLAKDFLNGIKWTFPITI